MSAPKSKTTKERLKTARLPERSISICLRGDLIADIQELERELEASVKREAGADRLAGGPRAEQKKIAGQIEAKRAEMAEESIAFRVRALKPERRNPDDAPGWRDLVRQYPPPKDDTAKLGVDLIPFMGEAIPLSVVSPDDMDAEDWETFNDNVPASELSKLMTAVWELNTEGVDIPKSLIASVVNRRNSDA